MAAALKGLIPQLPRSTWRILAYDAVSAVGGGMVLPFLIIYLHRVRGIDLDVAGAVLATVAIAGLVFSPLSGYVVDRAGARWALMGALVIAACGSLGLVFVHSTWQAFVAAAVFGAGEAAFWPAIQSLLAATVDERQRGVVFSVHYATINGGLGLGGIVGGFIADISRPVTFEALYLLNAITFLPFVYALVRSPEIGASTNREDEQPAAGGYLTVLRDPIFVRVWLLMALLVAIGYAQADAAFPAFAIEEGGIGTRGVGIAFATNTLLIVLTQLIVLKRAAGMRRTRAIVVLTGLWACYWSLVLVGAELSGALAVVTFASAFGLFALGETLVSPTIGTIVIDIAPQHLRGRYTAVYTLSWTVGAIVGPAAAGIFLDRGLGRGFIAGLIVCCGVGALGALRLERHLPAETNVVRSA